MHGSRSLSLLALLVLLGGCMVSFDRHPLDLDQRFADQIELIEDLAEDADGRARRVRVWAYDPDEDILVKVSVPVSWVATAGEIALDEAGREMRRQARSQGGTVELTELDVDLDLLVEQGPGAYVMVDDRDGRALVWIE